MDPHLANLSTNNDPPSETITYKVQELLATPLQELAEIDSEIAQLEERLKSLKVKRCATQISIEKYIAILSPLRRLPPDILHEIFYHCLPTHRNSVMNASDAPMLLTRVCSSWRTVALSSPRLWAQLHITFCDNYCIRTPEIVNETWYAGSFAASNEAFRVRAEKTLRMRCEVVKEWLERSGTCPLSISLYYSSGAWDPSELDSVGPITLELFRTLLLFKQRWREIELSMPMEIYRKLEDMVPVDTLHMLSVFKGGFHQVIPMSPLNEPDPVKFLRAPNLEKASLSGAARPWGVGRTPPVNWTQKLRYLCCHSSLNILDVVSLMKHLHNLEHFKAFIADFTGPAGEDPDDPRLQGLISLPRLQSLCITEDSAKPVTMKKLYDNIDAPSLKWIDYQKSSHNMIQYQLTDPDFVYPILSLLGKSSQLKKLTIDPNSMSTWNMRRVLQHGAHLTHLVIGQDPVGPSRILLRDCKGFHGGSPSGQDPFLELITMNENDSANPSKEILLPSLEVLEVSGTHSSDISDEQLIRFITSRMDPYSPVGIAVLKHVRIMFNRVKEMDVIKEVARFRPAKSGTELETVKLDLEYLLEPNPIYSDVLSPLFCLTEDGRSWIHPDIVEAAVS